MVRFLALLCHIIESRMRSFVLRVQGELPVLAFCRNDPLQVTYLLLRDQNDTAAGSWNSNLSLPSPGSHLTLLCFENSPLSRVSSLLAIYSTDLWGKLELIQQIPSSNRPVIVLVLYEAIAVITLKAVINPSGSHLSADACRTLSSLYLPHLPFSCLCVLPCVLEDTPRRYEDYMIQTESERFDKEPAST